MDAGRRIGGWVDVLARWVLGAQAVLLLGVAVVYGLYATYDERETRFLWGAAVVCLLFAVGAGAVAWGFATQRRFALGSAFGIQLMMAAAAVWLWGGWPVWGVLLLASAAVVAWAVSRRVSALPPRYGDATGTGADAGDADADSGTGEPGTHR